MIETKLNIIKIVLDVNKYYKRLKIIHDQI